jgi:hypothetical protein
VRETIPDEVIEQLTVRTRERGRQFFEEMIAGAPPASVMLPVSTPIQDQGQVGSSVAHATARSVEETVLGHHAMTPIGTSGGRLLLGNSWGNSVISAGSSTSELEARIRVLENQVGFLASQIARTLENQVSQARGIFPPDPPVTDPAPTVWERLDDEDPV